MHNCKSLHFCQIEENYGTLFSLKTAPHLGNSKLLILIITLDNLLLERSRMVSWESDKNWFLQKISWLNDDNNDHDEDDDDDDDNAKDD